MTFSNAIEVFISYAHEDEALRRELNKHLKSLEREGLIKTWNDRDMTAGSEWKREIDTHLESADVILLLISADFINSDYCFDVEMTLALDRHYDEDALVIPVILRACDWEKLKFGDLNALPKNGKPILSFQERDEAFLEVAEGIRQAIGVLKGLPATKKVVARPILHKEYRENILSAKDSEEKNSFVLQDIFFLSANPRKIDKAVRARETSKITQAIDNATLKRVKADNKPLYNVCIHKPTITARSASQVLATIEPHVIHISGLEDGLANLIVEDTKNNQIENMDSLVADLFRINTSDIHCVVLNGCYLESQARDIVQHSDFLIGIDQNLPEDFTLIFLDEFYFYLGLGKTIENAYDAGRHRLQVLQVDESRIPVLLSGKEEKYRRTLAKSLMSIDEEIGKEPNNALRWKQKGSLLQRLRLFKDADNAYDKAASLDPDNPQIREDQGDELEQSGEHVEAEAAYSKALSLLEEDDYKILWKKGKAQARAGQYKEAIASYDALLRLEIPSPDDYLICREYGYIFDKADKPIESITMYKRALKIQPRFRAASYERKWLYQRIYSKKLDKCSELS